MPFGPQQIQHLSPAPAQSRTDANHHEAQLRPCSSEESAPAQFHLLSFEGPDPYARAGGLASRVTGLAQELARQQLETHLWFVGDPDRPSYEQNGSLSLHRWCQWISAYHPGGVYDGELGKCRDYAASLPSHLLQTLLPVVCAGRSVTILAEEWHTAETVVRLDELLRRNQIRDRVRILWNANNTFGFDRIDWQRLAAAATITTVSRYMRFAMRSLGVDPLVIPNGLEPTAYTTIDPNTAASIAERVKRRLLLAKVARFDPDKGWLGAIDAVAQLKRRNARPLLIARGGLEAHGADVLERARQCGLVVSQRPAELGAQGLIQMLNHCDGVDLVFLTSHLDAEARSSLFHGASAVLANSSHEPFGLVGLEAMAVGGVACTGISGEDYAVSGHNAIVLQTSAPEEVVAKLERMRARPHEEQALRREGLATARGYSWASVLDRNLLPHLDLLAR